MFLIFIIYYICFLFLVVHITSLPYESIRSVHALPNNTFIVLLYKGLYLSETYTGWFIRVVFDLLGKVRPALSNMFLRGEMTQFDMKGKVVHNSFDSIWYATPTLIINRTGCSDSFLVSVFSFIYTQACNVIRKKGKGTGRARLIRIRLIQRFT